MQYPRAPIVEAIIELRFREAIDLDHARRAADKFQQDFPVTEDQENYVVQVGGAGEVARQLEWAGRKRSNLEATDVLRVATVAFTTMRLAPYAGWEQLFGRAQEQWARVRKALGKPTVSRLGCRFINRLDIPGLRINIEDYLKFGPQVPDSLGLELGSYFIQASAHASSGGGFPVTFRSGLTPSPLVNHTSYLLDIDVQDEAVSFVNEDVIWERLAEMRHYKNKLFESCITPKARALFS